MAKLDPVHPGEVLKHDFMRPLGLSDAGLAKAISVTPETELEHESRIAL